MNHKLIYDYIISKAQSEARKKGNGVYFEKHHILPKCLGGSNLKENLVLLTAREHFICHKLLVEIYPESNGLKYSLWNMVNGRTCNNLQRNYRVSSREYSRAKFLFSKVSSKMMSERIITDSFKTNLSKSTSGNNHRMWGKSQPEEVKQKMSKSHLGKTISKKTRLKISKTKKGEIKSKETRSRMSISNQLRPIKICPHCGYESRCAGNISRWHFDNCKSINCKSLFV